MTALEELRRWIESRHGGKPGDGNDTLARALLELDARLDALEARLAPVEPPDLKALFPALRDESGIEENDALRRLRDAAPSYSPRQPLDRAVDECRINGNDPPFRCPNCHACLPFNFPRLPQTVTCANCGATIVFRETDDELPRPVAKE